MAKARNTPKFDGSKLTDAERLAEKEAKRQAANEKRKATIAAKKSKSSNNSALDNSIDKYEENLSSSSATLIGSIMERASVFGTPGASMGIDMLMDLVKKGWNERSKLLSESEDELTKAMELKAKEEHANLSKSGKKTTEDLVGLSTNPNSFKNAIESNDPNKLEDEIKKSSKEEWIEKLSENEEKEYREQIDEINKAKSTADSYKEIKKDTTEEAFNAKREGEANTRMAMRNLENGNEDGYKENLDEAAGNRSLAKELDPSLEDEEEYNKKKKEVEDSVRAWKEHISNAPKEGSPGYYTWKEKEKELRQVKEDNFNKVLSKNPIEDEETELRKRKEEADFRRIELEEKARVAELKRIRKENILSEIENSKGKEEELKRRKKEAEDAILEKQRALDETKVRFGNRGILIEDYIVSNAEYQTDLLEGMDEIDDKKDRIKLDKLSEKENVIKGKIGKEEEKIKKQQEEIEKQEEKLNKLKASESEDNARKIAKLEESIAQKRDALTSAKLKKSKKEAELREQTEKRVFLSDKITEGRIGFMEREILLDKNEIDVSNRGLSDLDKRRETYIQMAKVLREEENLPQVPNRKLEESLREDIERLKSEEELNRLMASDKRKEAENIKNEILDKKISKVREKLGRVTSDEEGINDHVKNYRKQIEKEMDEAGDAYDKVVGKEIRRQSGLDDIAELDYLLKVYKEELKLLQSAERNAAKMNSRINRKLYSKIYAGAPFDEIQDELYKEVEAETDKIDTETIEATRDVVYGLSGAIAQSMYEKYPGKFPFVKYKGPSDNHRRCACRLWNGMGLIPSSTKAELQSWIDKGISYHKSCKGEKGGNGLREGTNASNFFIFRGGFACRHLATPITQTVETKTIYTINGIVENEVLIENANEPNLKEQTDRLDNFYDRRLKEARLFEGLAKNKKSLKDAEASYNEIEGESIEKDKIEDEIIKRKNTIKSIERKRNKLKEDQKKLDEASESRLTTRESATLNRRIKQYDKYEKDLNKKMSELTKGKKIEDLSDEDRSEFERQKELLDKAATKRKELESERTNKTIARELSNKERLGGGRARTEVDKQRNILRRTRSAVENAKKVENLDNLNNNDVELKLKLEKGWTSNGVTIDNLGNKESIPYIKQVNNKQKEAILAEIAKEKAKAESEGRTYQEPFIYENIKEKGKKGLKDYTVFSSEPPPKEWNRYNEIMSKKYIKEKLEEEKRIEEELDREILQYS